MSKKNIVLWLGLTASIITIFVFVTGIESLRDIFFPETGRWRGTPPAAVTATTTDSAKRRGPEATSIPPRLGPKGCAPPEGWVNYRLLDKLTCSYAYLLSVEETSVSLETNKEWPGHSGLTCTPAIGMLADQSCESVGFSGQWAFNGICYGTEWRVEIEGDTCAHLFADGKEVRRRPGTGLLCGGTTFREIHEDHKTRDWWRSSNRKVKYVRICVRDSDTAKALKATISLIKKET